MRTLLLVLALLIAPALPTIAQAQSSIAQDQAEGLFQTGYAHFEAQRFDEARAAFESALRLDPGHKNARSYLVELLVLQGDLEGARAVAQERPQPAAEPPQGPPIADPPESGGDVLSEEEAARLRAEAAAKQAEAQQRHALAQKEEAAAEARRAFEERERAQAEAHATLLKEKKERALRRNPRRGRPFAAGLAVGGAAGTFGIFSELRPGWLGSGLLGLGGFLVARDGEVQAAAALSAELQLSPVPWRLTPLVGGGIVSFLGSGASAVDSVLWSFTTSRDSLRMVPYALLGVRYDFKKALWFSVSARFAPSAQWIVMPMPGARIGIRF